MADPRGFLKFDRQDADRRPVDERLGDWREVYLKLPDESLRRQAARCMACGIPFCHEACPLGNLIPEWNDLITSGEWHEAAERLHTTNNFPEFTGRLCPAPCEGSCVLGINASPVTIKQVELEVANWATERLRPVIATERSGKKVAIVGSGPAGLAAAQQLTRAGHEVCVYERDDRPGGLLRYGVPEFKLEKSVIDRRLAQMIAEGTRFACSTAVGGAGDVAGRGVRLVPADLLVSTHDAVLLAIGARRPRDLLVPGRQLAGIHFAMDYLVGANRACEASISEAPISAAGRRVVIIGGGDTGADCLGTVHRQRASSVCQLEILARPPDCRPADNPWPTWPRILRSAAAHEEGGERLFSVATSSFIDGGNGAVAALSVESVRYVDGRFEALPGTRGEIAADLVLLALGFVGPEIDGAVADLGLRLDDRHNVAVDDRYTTNVPGVFACGDMARGQSLVVWAIAEGRSAAAAVDAYLSGSTRLPAPLAPGEMAII